MTAGAAGCTCASATQLTIVVSFVGTTGLVAGTTVKTCVTKMKLPHSSVTRYLLLIISGQVPEGVSSSQVTIGVGPLSVASSTIVGSGAGTSAKHSSNTESGLEAEGNTASPIVISCVMRVVLPQSSSI